MASKITITPTGDALSFASLIMFSSSNILAALATIVQICSLDIHSLSVMLERNLRLFSGKLENVNVAIVTSIVWTTNEHILLNQVRLSIQCVPNHSCVIEIRLRGVKSTHINTNTKSEQNKKKRNGNDIYWTIVTSSDIINRWMYQIQLAKNIKWLQESCKNEKMRDIVEKCMCECSWAIGRKKTKDSAH